MIRILDISSKASGYGLALAMFLPSSSAWAAKDQVLYSFAGGSDGADPVAGLIMDSAGNLYGTTESGGGGSQSCGAGCGTAFKVTPQGQKTVLYAFQGGSDGATPVAGLILDGVGNLYGTTQDGANDGGTVFKLAPNGTETVLHSFTGGSDGLWPEAGLIADKASNLYGTTLFGGVDNDGTAFKLAPDGTETVLHSFKGGRDGAYPLARLIADKKGNLFGTTSGGADDNGTVFKLAPNGKEAVLYAFKGGNDGAHPEAGLIADSTGNLFGTTESGGDANRDGTVFELAPDGTETVLYAFKGGSDGSGPFGGLTADSAGNLYGTTLDGGGANDDGTVFKLAPDGTETVLYAFKGGSDGAKPPANLLLHGKWLYGTTSEGGNASGCNGFGCGTIFKVKR